MPEMNIKTVPLVLYCLKRGCLKTIITGTKNNTNVRSRITITFRIQEDIVSTFNNSNNIYHKYEIGNLEIEAGKKI